jgi:cell division protein FtsL
MKMRTSEARKLKNTYSPVLYLLAGADDKKNNEKVLYGNGGLFYIMIIVILFACMGLLLNIALNVQNINYQKDIFRLGEMISIEEDRADRLKIEISSLRAPSRIMETAENMLGMQARKDLEVVDISKNGIDNNEMIFNYISKEDMPLIKGNYDNLLGTIYYVHDLVLVVSESVLTFFIP